MGENKNLTNQESNSGTVAGYTEFIPDRKITKEMLKDKFVEILPNELIHCKCVKDEEIASKNYDDGSFYAGHARILFSENDSGWYVYYNEKIYEKNSV